MPFTVNLKPAKKRPLKEAAESKKDEGVKQSNLNRSPKKPFIKPSKKIGK